MVLTNLELEKESFNSQINERIANGHIPDLRLVEDCDYFYNNTWRRKAYVKLDMLEQFDRIKNKLNECFPEKQDIKILEIGCGPGYIALELSRAGFDVTGIDLSDAVIEVANVYANQDPWLEQRGKLNYICGDIMTYKPECLFDAVVFVGALHHFKDQDGILSKVVNLLKNDGLVMVHEPTRDRVSKKNAAIATLIEVLVSAKGFYFEDNQIPETIDELHGIINRKYLHLKYEGDVGEKVQSPNDNDAGYYQMMGALEIYFKQSHFEDLYGLFHEIIGGLRYDESTNSKLAKFIHDMDHYLCEIGAVDATEFFYVGRKISNV